MQRGYSRDYYDVWRLLKENQFNDAEIKTLVKTKCELNNLEHTPSLLFNNKRLDEARAFWEKGLLYLTKELFLFELAIDEVKERLSFLQK